MLTELGENTKYDVISLYQTIFASTAYGSNVDLTESEHTPLFFSVSKSGELVKLLTGNGALFSSWRNSRGFLALNMNNTDLYAPRPHSLFYGTLFLDEAVNFYYNNGKEVRGIDAIWEPGSVNYGTYWHLINSGYDSYTAATNTWTGKVASRYSLPILQYPRDEFIDGKWVLTAKFGVRET